MKIYTTVKSEQVQIADRTVIEFLLTVHINDGSEIKNIGLGNSEFDIEMYQEEAAIHELIGELLDSAGVNYTYVSGEFLVG